MCAYVLLYLSANWIIHKLVALSFGDMRGVWIVCIPDFRYVSMRLLDFGYKASFNNWKHNSME